MADLTNKEITEACARVMGHRRDRDGGFSRLYEGIGMDTPDYFPFIYNPLTDRAQAMELVEKLRLRIAPYVSKNLWLAETQFERGGVSDTNLLRAICLCAARVQIEKEKNANG